MSDALTVGRDGQVITTSENAVLRGKLTAKNAVLRGDLTVADTLEIGDLTVANALITGDLTVDGTITGDVVVESVRISEITGLLGDGFSLQIPDVIDNLATVEISDMTLSGPMVIITGPGYDIERVPGFLEDGRPDDTAGFAMAHPFIFEASGADVDVLKSYFDRYLADPDIGGRDLSLIIQWNDVHQSELFRWNFSDFVPHSYEPSVDGRTRFRWVQRRPPDGDLRYIGFPVWMDPSQLPSQYLKPSFNPETDKEVEISGVTTFYPQVKCDEVNRTLTFTFEFREGIGIYGWVKDTIEAGEFGLHKRVLHVIEQENGVEVSRRNYSGCFPIKYEQFAGFGLPAKLKARLVISFDLWETG
jgi:hypothetical protein